MNNLQEPCLRKKHSTDIILKNCSALITNDNKIERKKVNNKIEKEITTDRYSIDFLKFSNSINQLQCKLYIATLKGL